MKMSIHCTVLTPAYNTSKYIQEAIYSVFQQKYTDWDIVVVNDGSTDNTERVVHELVPNRRISVVSLKKNVGVTEATAIGIEHCIGPVITILDSDDKLLPNSLQDVVPHFQDPELGFAWSLFQTSRGGRGWSGPLPAGKTLYEALVSNWWRASHQRFFRKSTYMQSAKLRGDIKASSDFQLALLVASTGCKTLHIPKITYWYRIGRPGCLSRNSRYQKRCVRQSISYVRENDENTCHHSSIQKTRLPCKDTQISSERSIIKM